MVVHFLLFLFFGAAIGIEKDKSILHPQESLQVVLKGEYATHETPHLFELLEEIHDQKRYGSFELESYKIVHADASHFQLDLTLKPMKLGTLIFAPGLLSLGNNAAAAIPSFEIECTRLSAPLAFFPPLPVRPEEAITLDETTRALVQNKMREGTISLLEEREWRGKIWTVLFSSLFCGMLLFAGSFFLAWYRRQRKASAPKIVRNWMREFEEVQTNSELIALLKDFYSEKTGLFLQSKTGAELQHIFHENEPLKTLFQRLEVAEFSGKPLEDATFQENLRLTKKLITQPL